MADQDKFFRALGLKVRNLRKTCGYSQEDMMSFGFSARHWQQVEAGRPITVTTLLRICEVLELSMEELVKGLDAGIYTKPSSDAVLLRKPRQRATAGQRKKPELDTSRA